MTNEELKKKIIEILEETEYEWTEEKNGYILQIFYDKLADALIAAGLTFEPMTFRIVENKPYSYTAGELANWKEDQDRITKLLHRAQVAEGALRIADELGELCGKKQDYIQQAEKELAEDFGALKNTRGEYDKARKKQTIDREFRNYKAKL